jgi:hypothetical protein
MLLPLSLYFFSPQSNQETENQIWEQQNQFRVTVGYGDLRFRLKKRANRFLQEFPGGLSPAR